MSTEETAPTFHSRLAAACNCAYAISTGTGEYLPPPVYDAAADWQSKPIAVSAREKGQQFGPYINACLVGLNHDGLIVAFRGTLPPALTVASFEDWWQDFSKSAPVHAAPLPGKVHAGFWEALETVWPGVLSAIEQLSSKAPSASIFVTGHSKGGPMATLAGARLLLANSIQANQIITFASPYPGDVEFVTKYPAELPVTRFENYLDMVPFVPPSKNFFKFYSEVLPGWLQKDFCKWFPSVCTALENASQWDYASLGTLQYITSSGDVVAEESPKANRLLRIAEIIGEIVGINDVDFTTEMFQSLEAKKHSDTGFTRVGAAHCIACKSDNPVKYCAGGYMTGSGGKTICPAP